MNHQGNGKRGTEGGKHPTQKSEDIPSKLAGAFEHARRPEEESGHGGTGARGVVNTPRGSAHDDREASTRPEDLPGAMPAALGDRDEREAQYSEPATGFTESEDLPQSGLQDADGDADASGLDSRGEDDSRRRHDVSRSALSGQKRRLGLGDRDSSLPGENRRH